MPIEHDDVQELKKVFDDRYVLQTDCDITQQKINSKFANDDKRIELLVRQQTINNWLTGAIASGIIALLIKVFLGG
jgi:hypothetical protein